jgi:nitroreductase
MNPALKFIFARRSVRKFQNKDVSEETVKDLLEAAMAAPSAVAKDPWHFIVVRDAIMRKKLAEGLPYGKMLMDSPVGIVVCGDMEKAHDRQISYLLQDCSAATENLLVAVSALGLGAVWLGVHPREERMAHVRAIFGLPENIIPVSAIALGWPSEKPIARTRYGAGAVHAEKW